MQPQRTRPTTVSDADCQTIIRQGVVRVEPSDLARAVLDARNEIVRLRYECAQARATAARSQASTESLRAEVDRLRPVVDASVLYDRHTRKLENGVECRYRGRFGESRDE